MILEVKDLSKSCGGLLALCSLTFAIGESELVGVIGPNGSRKSTAFNTNTGAIPASSGQIIFRGDDITRRPAHAVAARGIGRTFQQAKPLSQMTTLQM